MIIEQTIILDSDHTGFFGSTPVQPIMLQEDGATPIHLEDGVSFIELE